MRETVWRLLAHAAAGAVLLVGCAPIPQSLPGPAPALLAAKYRDLPLWQQDQLAEILPTLRHQCRRLALLPLDAPLGGIGLAKTYGGHPANWTNACAALIALPQGADLHGFFETWFQPYQVHGDGLITGYFEPTFAGALQRGGIYATPVFARPTDLVEAATADAQGRPILGRAVAGRVVPYDTRQQIEAGSLGRRSHPVAWLASPVDLLFAQIQGSARIQLQEGGVLRLAFDGRNGRPYTPIGRLLVAEHAIRPDEVSMQTIRAWLEAHPALAAGVMDRNESYVFFKVATEDDPSHGPPGALGIALTAGRSAAVDRAFVPLGLPVYIASSIPDGRSWDHLVLAQDLGSAVTGQARIDVFWGAGREAGEWAGRMHQAGAMWLLLPRPPEAAPRSP